MYGKEYERNESLSMGKSGTQERKAKKRDWEWGWEKTMFLEHSLQRKASQHVQAGNSATDASYSWILLWLNSPSQLMDSSLYRNQTQQLESFFY